MDIRVFRALADPNRLRIVEALRDGPTAVGEVADKLSLRQALVSSHLKVLSQVGLVSVRPVAQRRLYELRPERFDDVVAWASSFETVWNARLDRLEAQLRNRAHDRPDLTTRSDTGEN